MTKTLIAALVAATALLAPAASQAATVSLENGTIVYRGEGAEGNHLLVSTFKPYDDPNTYLSLDDSAPQTIVNGPCFKYGDFDPWVLCPLDPSQPLRVEGGAGNDDIGISISSDAALQAKPIELHGGDGNDQVEDVYDSVSGRVLTGGTGNDTVLGHGGNDEIDGGDGNDVVDGGEGDDQVRGGAGDDEMWGDHYKAPGADLLDGGPGTDTTEEWGIPSDLTSQPRTNVTLDGAANDGRPGEGDNVVGIERIRVSVVGDYAGTDGADEIKVINPATRARRASPGAAATTSSWPRTSTTRSTAAPATTSSRAAAATTSSPAARAGHDHGRRDQLALLLVLVPDPVGQRHDPGPRRREGQHRLRDRVPTPRWSTRSTSSPTARTSTAQRPGRAPVPDRARLRSRSRASRRSGRSRPRASTLAVACPTACKVSGELRVDRKTARKIGSNHVGSGSARAKAAGTAPLKLKLASNARSRFKRLSKATLTVRVTVKATAPPRRDRGR